MGGASCCCFVRPVDCELSEHGSQLFTSWHESRQTPIAAFAAALEVELLERVLLKL